LSITGGRNKYDPLSKYRPPPGTGGTPADRPKVKPHSSGILKASADNTGGDPDDVGGNDVEDSDNEIDNESILNNQVRELKEKLKMSNDRYSVLVSQNKGNANLKTQNEHLEKLNKAASSELRRLKEENAEWERRAVNANHHYEAILKALEEGKKATATVGRRLTRLMEQLDDAGLLGRAPSQPDPNAADHPNPNPNLLPDPGSERGVTDPGEGTGEEGIEGTKALANPLTLLREPVDPFRLPGAYDSRGVFETSLPPLWDHTDPKSSAESNSSSTSSSSSSSSSESNLSASPTSQAPLGGPTPDEAPAPTGGTASKGRGKGGPKTKKTDKKVTASVVIAPVPSPSPSTTEPAPKPATSKTPKQPSIKKRPRVEEADGSGTRAGTRSWNRNRSKA
jgi:hypothetical protein